ncbi:hypothetical protein XELAEV_18044954mg [Xenopus laevis]|uniref:Uncharacterized protein n=1 Tax=Xenopus laevis TaxID=8355 RepID=A0A974H3U2_XENLA|nr:hypothetical protein XELAEV_18044954mg [Xenopus laevis]
MQDMYAVCHVSTQKARFPIVIIIHPSSAMETILTFSSTLVKMTDLQAICLSNVYKGTYLLYYLYLANIVKIAKFTKNECKAIVKN